MSDGEVCVRHAVKNPWVFVRSNAQNTKHGERGWENEIERQNVTLAANIHSE